MDLKKAIDSAQRSQRNYDLSKSIPQDDLETLIYAAVNSPSKQNETHYSLYVYTDQDIIRQIYNNTKKFTMIRDQQDADESFKVENDIFIQDDTKSVTNSQIYANVLFAYVEEQGDSRGVQHKAAKENPNSTAAKVYNEQIAYSMGISVGELILTANLLGYKTGICSAMDSKPIKKIVGSKNHVKLLVGVGFDNAGTDRRLHAELLNKDVPEKFRTGNLDDQWRFPSFEKHVKVFINGINT